MVNNGATLSGSGTIQRTVVVASGGTLSPGDNGPGVLSTGQLLFQSGSVFAVDVDGPQAGSGYGQVVVNGSGVSLGNATLLLEGGFSPAPGSVITLISNKGPYAVSPGFNGLADGSVVGVGSFSGFLSYEGNTGADVTLTAQGPASIQGGSGNNSFVLVRKGNDLQVLDNGVLEDSRPLATVSSYMITGSNNGVNSLKIDLASGGTFGFSGAVYFQGGTGEPNYLGIVGGTFSTANLVYTGPQAGNLNLTPASGLPLNVSYTGGAMLDLSSDSSTNLNIVLPASGNLVDLADKGQYHASGLFSGNGTFTPTLFTDPSGALQLNAGTGGNSLNLTRTGPTSAAYVLDGGAGNNYLNVDFSSFTGQDNDILSATALESAELGNVFYMSSGGGSYGYGVQVALGNGGNQVQVLGTPAGATTILRTGAGNDAVNVVTANNGLGAPLVVDEGAGANSLSISDAGRAPADQYWVTSQATADAVGDWVVYYQATGGSIAGLGLSGGNGNDTYNLLGQPTGTATTLTGGAGNDTFQVAVTNASGYSGVTVDGGGGTNVMVVYDTTGNAIIHNIPSSPSSGQMQVLYAGGSQSLITYKNVQDPFSNVSADESYIEALYQEDLGYAASPSELSYWLGVLATSGRGAVAAGIDESLPALTETVYQWYAQYLNSPADANVGTWVALLQKQGLETTLAQFLGSATYYQQSGGTDSGFVVSLYQELLQRNPSQSEYNTSLKNLSQLGRSGLAFSILGGQEYRGLAVAQYYIKDLQQQPTQADLNAWIFTNLSLQQILVQIQSSQAFYTYGT